MARHGTFDRCAVNFGWFDETAQADGWFVTDGLFQVAAGFQVQRALYWNGQAICQVTDAIAGTGKKPLVILNNEMKERSVAEGIPVILVDGRMRCIDAATETLLI